MFLADRPPYALDPAEKRAYLVAELGRLVTHHEAHCPPYARVVADWRRQTGGQPQRVEDFPFLPVTVFKEFALKSTDSSVLSVKSSATTTGQSSVVFVDKETRKRQTLSANKLWTDYLGTHRRPYLVFDLEATVRGAASLSARGAAILSLAPLASEFYFVAREVDGRLAIDERALAEALAQIGDQPLAGYGFTYILYQLHQELAAMGRSWPRLHPQSVLLHSGGWKRLVDLAVDKPTFNRTVAGVWGLEPGQVIDFYGAVEQVGLVYPDCPTGVKHVPYWAEIVLRDRDTLAPLEPGGTGLLQLVNCLPLGAPNHSVLTEDLGELVYDDGCPCGRRGRAFVFRGRAPKSEVRGCSDVARG